MEHLSQQGHRCIDLGTNIFGSVDYPQYAHNLAALVLEGRAEAGFAFCGTGNGVAMTLNRHPHIRAGVAWNAAVAELIRRHNNANVCVIPARFTSAEETLQIADAFMAAEFERGRHQKRIEMIEIF